MGVRLWSRGDPVSQARPWGPPRLVDVRPEHRRVVLFFEPVSGAGSYTVRCESEGSVRETISGVRVTPYSIQGLANGARYTFAVAAVGPLGTTAFSNSLSAVPSEQMDWKSLESAFRGDEPTRTSCPFWMVHGNESDDELRESLRQVERFGFEGVTLHPYDYRDFLGEGNWGRWRLITEEARKLGLTVWEQDDQDYPCGYAAGKVVAMNRNWARWEMVLAHSERFHGPRHVSLVLNEVLVSPRKLVAASALGPDGRFSDLTTLAANGRLEWNVPSGEWECFVVGAWQPGIDAPQSYPDLVRGQVRGYIDPLSPQACDEFVRQVLAATSDAVGREELGRTWKGFYIDEPGFYSSGTTLGDGHGGYPYTPDLLDRFAAAYGYNLRPSLPLLWVERGGETSKVRYDYMDFVSLEYARLFIGKQREFSEAHGMQVNGHVREDLPYQLGAGTGSNFRTLEAFSMGGFDHIFDQWYTPEDDVYWRQAKMASSISHALATPADEAMVEHFAATGWRTGLTEMKAMMDWTTCRGLSRIVPCGVDTRNPPVWEDQPEFWLHGRNPLAPYFRQYQNVANRETMLIRGGRHVARAIVLDNAESAWVGSVEDVWRVAQTLSQAHLDYDLVSYGIFSNPSRCRLEGGRLHIAREDYDVVVLPLADAMPYPLMSRLAEFFQAGGTVILVGPGARVTFDAQMKSAEIVARLPIRSTDGRHDVEVKKLAEAMWGEKAAEERRALHCTYKDLGDVLYRLDLHDVWIDPNLSLLQYYHRRLSGRDLYFFNNEGPALATTVRLRGVRGVPELWDPSDGTIRQAPVYTSRGEELSVWLRLARYESVFVVVNPEVSSQPHLMDSNADDVLRERDARLALRKFSPGSFRYTIVQPNGSAREAESATPAASLEPIELRRDWVRKPESQGVLYQASFDWRQPAESGAVLEICDMNQVIFVRLNGQDLGMRFAYPFQFDLSRTLRAGRNEVEIRHVERDGFTSHLGRVRVVPYYRLVA